MSDVLLWSGIAGAALAFLLAVLVLASAPRRRFNRLLAVVLGATGVWALAWEAVDITRGAPQVTAFALTGLAMGVMNAAYLGFLADLQTPFARPLRAPPIKWTLRATLAVAAGSLLVAALALPAAARDAAEIALLPYVVPNVLLSALILLYALPTTVSAYRRAEAGTPARTRARAWAAAFLVRDGAMATGIALVMASGLVGREAFASALSFAADVAFTASIIFALPLLAYGLLKTQVFDIDLKIKWSVERATLAAIFLTVILGTIALVGRITTEELGIAAGGIGAALLLFAILPLHRFSERVADRLMPGARASDDYLTARKLQVYRAALEDIWAEGGGEAEDAHVLAALRRGLGITDEQHRVLVMALRPRRPSKKSVLEEQFKLIRELGSGSGGSALLARDRSLGRAVVLKRPRGFTGDQKARALQEARAAARIHHPNVVAVHQILADESPPVIVMEHVDGDSLEAMLAERGRFSPEEVVRVGLQVLAGLSCIHAAGIVHRDLKPANILVTREGVAKVADFGVAHDLAGGASHDDLASRGFQPGSPAYMSPEQAAGDTVDGRSDLYSVGIVLREMLSGHASPNEAATITHATMISKSAALPSEWRSFFSKALAADKVNRFQTPDEMADAVRGLLAPAGRSA